MAVVEEYTLEHEREPKCILLAEDDERIVSFLKRGLEAEDYRVDCVRTKPDAIRALKCGNYAVVILDIYLGPDNGLDICRELRSWQNATPILVVSATGSPDMKKSSVLAGANAFLPKPFSFDQLVSKIQEMDCVNPDAAAISM